LEEVEFVLGTLEGEEEERRAGDLRDFLSISTQGNFLHSTLLHFNLSYYNSMIIV